MNNERYNLKNKVSVITGGAGFFGVQIAEALHELNSKVILLDINQNNLLISKKELDKKAIKVEILKCDITSESSVLKTYNLIKKKFKRIDVLVNNACIDYKPKKKNKKKISFENSSTDQWTKEINVGLTGTYTCCKIFTRAMKNNSVILNIASDLSVIAPDQSLYSHMNTIKPITYSTIKHGLIGITKYLAAYFSNRNIRVNAISPGGIENNQNKVFIKKLKKLIPLKRLAKKNEYKEAVQFLCSDASSYMTGHNLIIDGGRTIL